MDSKPEVVATFRRIRVALRPGELHDKSASQGGGQEVRQLPGHVAASAAGLDHRGLRSAQANHIQLTAYAAVEAMAAPIAPRRGSRIVRVTTVTTAPAS